MVTYLTRFQWDLAKYPIKQSLKNIAEIIGKVRHTSFFQCHSMNSCISPWVGARCHIFYWNYFLASFTDWNRLENKSHCIQQSEGKSTEPGKKVHVSCCFLTYMYWENNLKSSITNVYLNQEMDVKSCCFRGSLFTRNLTELVKREDFVLDSEYLQTLLVVVPK